MVAPILTTKLYAPPVRPGLVSRPRLVERLNTGLRGACRLTLISAPAGFGKTTLLSEWICSLKSQISDLKIAWLSLDEGDNDPARFLVYVVAALQTQVDAGHGVLEALQSPHHPPATASTSPSLAEWMEKLVTALINEISLVPASLILILDDYHFITARPIHATVAFLLDHLPPNLHVVIGSRSDPPLHLARLRARGQLGELRQSDLRFTLDEAAEFLKQVAQVEFSTSDIAALASRTEGWAAGLQMAALALSGTLAPRARDDIARFIRAFTGSNRYVLDYLVEEVFQRQPESVQTFLLHTSILDELTGSLCNAVSHRADGQATLEQLERANLFIVPLDDERRWYRYHRLFADLLRHRLQLTQPDLAPSLHLRASEWYERAATSDDSGWMAGAIRHAAAARDHARAARLIEQAAQPTLARSEVATFLNWISLLPDEAVRAQPRLRVYQAMALLLDGRSPDTVETILHEAEQANSGNSLAGEAMAIRALSAAYQGDAERSATLARRALELLPEDNILLRGFAIGSLGLSYLWSEDLNAAVRTFEEGARIGEKAGNVMFTVLALRRVGRLRMAQGKLHEARSLFERALELSVDRQGQRLPIAGTVLIAMGYLYREWNDLETATRYLTEGIELAQKASASLTIGANIMLARIKHAEGDEVGAREMMHSAEQLAARTESTAMDDFGVALSQATLYIAQGDLESARAWAESRGLNKNVALLAQEIEGDSISSTIRRYEMLVLARLMIVQNRPRDALTLLDLVLARMEREGRIETAIEIQILRALAFQAAGDSAQALAAVERALTLAEPSGYIRTFADEGEPMRLLLQRIKDDDKGMKEYLGKLLAAFGTKNHVHPSSFSPQPLLEPLSERELEVLRLLAAGLSNPDIARELYIAVSTVRSHAKSIYGKLNVHGRWEAAQRAQELGLL